MGKRVYVLAPDSFKESMTAQEACQAMAVGIRRVQPDATILQVPMADGGEGTMAVLVEAQQGRYQSMMVHGPLENQMVQASYGIINNGETAIIEMAQASGLGLVPKEKRQPLDTSSYGTGELFMDALAKGVKTIVLTLGGSATNDAGAGMLQALGGKLMRRDGQPISWGNAGLSELAHLDLIEVKRLLANRTILLVSDVNNPLLGKTGATAVFAKQKGAVAADYTRLEENMKRFVALLEKKEKKEFHTIPGSGAAGGLALPLLALGNATFVSGVQYVAEKVKLSAAIQKADWVFTGEGGIDFQTKFGKTPYGVAQVARQYHKPTIAFAGKIGLDIDSLYAEGFDAIFGILGQTGSLDQALSFGPENLARTVENVVHLLQISQKG